MAERWLLADLGGTNTRLGLAVDGRVDTASVQSFANADFSGLAPLVDQYLQGARCGRVSAFCAGVAGPVRAGAAQLTNYDWYIDRSTLSGVLGSAHVSLMNDLQAQGFALNDLTSDHVTPLFEGALSEPHSVRMVMGLGTGSNIAVVHDTPTGLLVPPAEAGHTSLPFAEGRCAELIAHLGTHHTHRPIESAVSGPGLVNIYHWLTGKHITPAEIMTAQKDGQPDAVEALDLFCDILGQVAGDLCLTHLPMGGLFFIGGMARAVGPVLADSGFYSQFCAKGPYADIMRDIPIHLITDDNAALLGCARYLAQTL